MKNLNHERPELRYKDNIRRENLKEFAHAMKPKSIEGWPLQLQPLAQNTNALKALGSLMREIDLWIGRDDEDFSLSNPPQSFKASLNNFLEHRIDFAHSGGLTIKDWLDQEIDYRDNKNDLRNVIQVFRDIWS
jgi:hypothetical protein